jgi:hypothetical protein
MGYSRFRITRATLNGHRNELMIKILKTAWFRGGPVHWGQVRYNNGDIYTSYRFGPIVIQVRR